MINNWQLQPCEGNDTFPYWDCTDCEYEAECAPRIGDEIWTDHNGYNQWGVVVGIIRDFKGMPACYKVWRYDDDWLFGAYDYIQASRVYGHDMSGDAVWSLGRIGYELLGEGDDQYLYNEITKDVIEEW